MEIECKLVITAGGPTRQNKLRLEVGSEIVFDDFEGSLADSQRLVAKQIAAAQARALHKWATQAK